MLTKALSVDPIYLRYKEMDKAIDYRVSYKKNNFSESNNSYD